MKIQHEINHDITSELLPEAKDDDFCPNWAEVIVGLDMNRCFQLRVSYPYAHVKNHLAKILEKTQFFFIFQHDKDNEVNRTHIHAYLFNCSYAGISIRTHLKNVGYSGNADFSLGQKAGQGREPLTVAGAWRYGTTVDLQPPIHHNISDPRIVRFLAEDAESYYEDWRREENAQKDEFRVMVLEKRVAIRDNTWEYLFNMFQSGDWPIQRWTVDQFKTHIARDWLNRGKALMRASDLHRYATSLYLIRKCIREIDFRNNKIGDIDPAELLTVIRGKESAHLVECPSNAASSARSE